jgi:hypothetical protein
MAHEYMPEVLFFHRKDWPHLKVVSMQSSVGVTGIEFQLMVRKIEKLFELTENSLLKEDKVVIDDIARIAKFTIF